MDCIRIIISRGLILYGRYSLLVSCIDLLWLDSRIDAGEGVGEWAFRGLFCPVEFCGVEDEGGWLVGGHGDLRRMHELLNNLAAVPVPFVSVYTVLHVLYKMLLCKFPAFQTGAVLGEELLIHRPFALLIKNAGSLNPRELLRTTFFHPRIDNMLHVSIRCVRRLMRRVQIHAGDALAVAIYGINVALILLGSLN